MGFVHAPIVGLDAATRRTGREDSFDNGQTSVDRPVSPPSFDEDDPVNEKHSSDRRVRRTQALLHQAIGSLIHEKPYDTISVKEILDRASVGRSTFYMHFRDKDELLVSGMREMLRKAYGASKGGARSERLLLFSRPIFAHVEEHRHASGDRMGRRGRATLHDQLRRVLAEIVRAEVGDGPRMVRGMPRELLVRHVTSTFVIVLDWWIESGTALRAGEVSELFESMVHPALARALD
jgi:AcrR family transcriptional regulator